MEADGVMEFLRKLSQLKNAGNNKIINTLTEINIMEYCDVAEYLHWFLSSKCKLRVSRKKEVRAVVNHARCMNYSHHNCTNVNITGFKSMINISTGWKTLKHCTSLAAPAYE